MKEERKIIKQDVPGITNRLLSFDTRGTAQKTKNIKGETQRV
jgi:hypothetical protein